LGVALRLRGVPVTVLEAGSYPRHRVCGEFISGISASELEALGIVDCLDGCELHTQTAWYDRKGQFLARSLPSPAHGLSRYTLDLVLANRLTELGGELRTGVRATEDTEGMVWATGREKQSTPWVGLKAHFEDLPLEAGLEIHFGNLGYLGLTRVEGGRVNACGLFHRKEPVRKGNPLITAVREAGLEQLAARLEAAQCVEGSIKGVNHFSLGWQREVADGRARLGDAAALIPPFTGNGMTMAFQSALAVLEPLTRWSQGVVSWADTLRLLAQQRQKQFGSRLRWALLMQEVLMRPAGRKLALWMIRSGLVRFETLYQKVR
jgi:2-polyprenyl-6-methoxyphenol hydroxylase-like FAD-dependent oxidoreductase